MDGETTLGELKELVEGFVSERDWSQFHTPKNLSMALAIEASELMEIPRERARGVVRGSRQRVSMWGGRMRWPGGFITACLGLSLLTLGIWREVDLRGQWEAVPAARAGDLSSVGQRVEDLGRVFLYDEARALIVANRIVVLT